MRIRPITTTVAALAAAALLGGCGGADSTAPAPENPAAGASSAAAAATTEPAVFGDADVAFAREMIPHHEQAVEMAALAPGRSTNQEVLDLASGITTSQQPEIEQLNGFLQAWNVDPTPNPSKGGTGDTGGMDHSGHGDMMMSEADLDALGSLSGADFDRQWLDQMISHHEGAITMAEIERTDGLNPDARALADQIVSSQQGEIDQMAALLPQG